jgi:hypothetical protein
MTVIADEQREFGLFNNSVGYTGHDSTQNIQALDILSDIEQNNKSGKDKETDTNDDKSIKEKQTKKVPKRHMKRKSLMRRETTLTLQHVMIKITLVKVKVSQKEKTLQNTESKL